MNICINVMIDILDVDLKKVFEKIVRMVDRLKLFFFYYK